MSRYWMMLFPLTGVVLSLCLGRLTPAQAAVAPKTSSQTITFPEVDFNPCVNGGAGEFIVLTVRLRVVFRDTTLPSGKHQVIMKFIDEGTSGVGQTTGDVYRRVGTTQDDFVATGDVGSVTTFQETFNIIGPGKGNNLLVHDIFHVTINAGGTVTVAFDHFRFECK